MQNHGVDPFGIVGQVLDAQFRVDRLVGEGGFSAVYRGHHLGLDEPIAIKCLKLPPSLSPSLVEQFAKRFRDESRILYRLSQGNLNIVRSIAAGTWQANTGAIVPYMILEWMEGRSLANEFTIRRTVGHQGRPLADVVNVFAPAADGLGYAHSQGVVHRDLNPGNLFLAATPQGPRMKVLDFGVAKILDDSTLNIARTQTVGAIRVFAPAYGSPEQFDDKVGIVGPASDVYSFALILLEALRDRCVNDCQHLGELAQRALDPQRRPTPRAFSIDVPDEVEQVFARATRLDPRERWQSAGELWKALTIAATSASEQRHVRAAKETPALAMPPVARGTQRGMGPAAAQAVDRKAPGPAAPQLAKTLPIGSAMPDISAARAAASPSGEVPNLDDPTSDDAPTRVGVRSPQVPLPRPRPESQPEPQPEPEDEVTRVRAPEPDILRGLADADAARAAERAPPQPGGGQLAKTMPLAGPHPLGMAAHHAAGSSPMPAAGSPPQPQSQPQQHYQPQPQPQPAHQQQPAQPQHVHPQHAYPQQQQAPPPMQPQPFQGGGGFAPPPSHRGVSPSSAAIAGAPKKNSAGLLIAVGFGALAVIGIVVAVVVTVLGKRAGKSDVPSTATAAEPAPTASASVPPPASEPAPPAEPATAAAAVGAGAEDGGAEEAEPAPSATPSTTTTEPPSPAPPPPPPPPGPAPAPSPPAKAKPVDPNAFDEAAARSRLGQANGILVFCKKPGGVTGPGFAAVTFANDGTVSSVRFDPPYSTGTPTGDCVAGHLKRAKVNPFQGPEPTLRHAFAVPQ